LKLAFRKLKACEENVSQHSVNYSYSKTLGSLATLTTLRTLSAQVRSLFGRDWKDVELTNILPTSLERLELADLDEYVLCSGTRATDTGLLPTIGPEEIGANESRNMRRHIDRELACILDDERFGRLSQIIVVCTSNPYKL